MGLALALVVVLSAPFVASLLRAVHAGWVPNGDDANIATRALDVFSRHPPLTGLPSTSGLYGDKIATNHPGPLEFYLLAVPLRVLGESAGPLLTAAAINAAFVLVAAWTFFRRLGLQAALWAGLLLAAVMWSAGTSVLSDPLSSNMTMYSVLATTVLAWALIDGDLALLPLTAFVASYAAQQHLAAGLVVAPLVVVVAAVLGVDVVQRVRRGDTATKRSATRWSAIALVVAVVCWTPVLYDEATGHPGNLTAIVRFARDSTRQKLGLSSGFHQVIDAIAPPSMLGRSDTTGSFFLHAPGAARVALGLLVIVALALVAWRTRRTARPVSRLALLSLLVLALGVYNGSNVPNSGEAARINLYRWTWAAALLTWAALGLGVAVLVGTARRAKPAASRSPWIGPVVLVVVAALISTGTIVTRSQNDRIADRPEFNAERRIADAVLAKVDRRRPVLVLEVGADATLAVGPYVIFRLVRAGFDVEVTALTTVDYGKQRRYRPRSNPSILTISSGSAQLPAGAGTFVAREPFGAGPTAAFDALAETRTKLIEQLASAARGTKVELAPGAETMITRDYSTLEQFALWSAIGNLPTQPQAALANKDLLRLALAGGLRTPRLDPATIHKLLALPAAPSPGMWGDDQVQARLTRPGPAAAGQPVPSAAT